MTRRRSLVIATAAVAVLLATAGCTASSSGSADSAVVPASLSVEGYGTASPATVAALKRSRAAVDIVGISGVSISPDGNGVRASSSESLSVLKSVHAAGKKAELLVNNYDADTGSFDPTLATSMLSSSANRDFAVAGLAAEVVHGGYDGVQLDFESLSASNADDLVKFATELRETLPTTATVSMAVTAESTTDAYEAAGYDLPALAKPVGRFVLMAYDEHTPSSGDAGPVGGLPWARQTVSAATSLISASKVDIAVAGYGYSWKQGGGGASVTVAKARSEAGSRARWVEAQGEWTAKLADGTVLWWSDAKSLTVRANLAKSLDLHGVALWQMSTADRITRP